MIRVIAAETQSTGTRFFDSWPSMPITARSEPRGSVASTKASTNGITIRSGR